MFRPTVYCYCVLFMISQPDGELWPHKSWGLGAIHGHQTSIIFVIEGVLRLCERNGQRYGQV